MSDTVKTAIISGCFVVLAAIVAGLFSINRNSEDALECYFPDTPAEKAPSWVCFGRERAGMVFAVGFARKTEAGSSYMKRKAVMDAKSEIVESASSDVEKIWEVEAGKDGGESKTIRSTSKATIYGSRVYESIMSPNGNMFVLVGAEIIVRADK